MADLISLGIAGMAPAKQAPPAPAAAGAPSMLEMGATGTAIFGGQFLRDLGEYNPDFSGGPFSAYRVYEQMRRGDAQVAATLAGIKLPVRCGEWAIQAPEDPTPAEQEAADFVEDALLEQIDFDAALQNALLCLDFGCACHEDCWQYDGQVKLRKLAPRLPMTFYAWETDEATEELETLVQLGYRGTEYQWRRLPADKIALFTYQQEGGNFAGRSLLRAMYQHWYIKANLYKVDAIAQERNGCGVPVATLAPGATVEDRKKLETFLNNLAVHEHAWMVMPDGYGFKLHGVEGQIKDPKDSIAHHNTMISMAGLAQFMMLGQGSSSGNRALGETMSDFFYLSLQSLANQVARVFSLTTIRRLTEYNFAGVRPPRLVPQKILAVKFESVVEALSKLATSGIVTPTPELEAWLREMMGAPEADGPTIVQERRKRTTSIPNKAPDAGAQPGADDGDGAGPVDTGGAADKGQKNAKPGDSNGGKVAAGFTAADGMKLRREPKPVERCLALAQIAGALDKGRDEVAAALRAARSRVQAGVVQKLMGRPIQQAHQVSLPLDDKLVGEVEAILRGVYGFGLDQVGEEIARQKGGAALPDAAKIRAAVARRKGDPIGVYADAVVSEFQNDLTARAARVTLDYRRRQGDMTDGEVFRLVEEEIDGQSDRWMDGIGSKGANEAFADGRQDGYEEHASEIGSVIYSALLDINTCEACAAADGEEGATPEDVPGVPNPDCDGGDKCRCVHVYVFATEGKAA